MQSYNDLQSQLKTIDHKSYPLYKSLRGSYQFPKYILSIDHVQGDPFAAPSDVRVTVDAKAAGFPAFAMKDKLTRTALADELLRNFAAKVNQFNFKAKGSGKSGLISVTHCGQEVLQRTACEISEKEITARFAVGFPANGRTINARELEKILFEFVPECVRYSLFYKNMNEGKLREIIDLAEDQHYIREMLSELGLCAFVANGSILPRESGISAKPMRGGVKFISSKEQEVTLELPHKGKLTGMGIKKGITLIVGGGYHGKSTLLKALELGVYDHIAGDGREYVITDASALKLRAEDGRSIQKTDISMFINDLPNGKDTVGFCTEDASGSTSQAANVVEGIEAGTKLLLIDEDTSATNFMIRDELMQRVIHREMEPITPFIERIRELYEEYDISTVIVAGSSGAYFHIADSVIQMDRYMPKDITAFAKKEAETFPAISVPEVAAKRPDFRRCPTANRELKSGDRVKMKVMGCEAVSINRDTIDLRYVEQLTDSEQLTTLGYCIRYAQKQIIDGKKTLQEIVGELEKTLDKGGLEALSGSGSSVPCMAMPRRQEIFACFNRYRGLKL